jgi:iron complex outermembrane receptor protein
MLQLNHKDSTPPYPLSKIYLSLLAACVVAAGAPVVVQAQEQVIEEVVVRGARASLRSAIETKRQADTFVDAISALDLGVLPDRSVLEAMQRIPGVTIERVAEGWPDYFSVEGRGLAIRGMSATRSEFNGRDAFHASGRGLSFGDIAPELLAGVNIYKNQTADMIEGGIGGTVSLLTRKPFDQEGQLIAFNSAGRWGDLTKDWTPEASGLYSNRWQTNSGEFGFLIQAQTSERNAMSHGAHINPYVPYAAWAMAGAESFMGDGTGTVNVPSGANFTQREDENTTDGGFMSFQWRSNDDKFLLTAEYIRSASTYSFGQNWLRYDGGTSVSSRNTRAYGDTQLQFDENGTFQSGTLAHANYGWRAAGAIGPGATEPNTRTVNPYIPRPWYYGDVGGMAQFGHDFTTQTERNETARKLEDISLNLEWTPNDNWTVEFDYQRIDATQKQDINLMSAQIAAMQTLDLTGNKPSMELLSPWNGERDNNPAAYNNGVNRPGFTDDPQGDRNYFQDPTSYSMGSAWDIFGRDEGESDAFRIDADYVVNDSSWLTNIKFGARRVEREQLLRDAPVRWGAISPEWATGTLYMDHVADQGAAYNMFEATSWSEFHRGDVLNIAGGNSLLGFSQDYVQRMLDSPICIGDPAFVQRSPAGTWDGGNRCREGVDSQFGMFLEDGISNTVETNTAAYVRLDWELNDLPFRVAGNFGLRYVELDRKATGFVRSPGLDQFFDANAGYQLPAGQTAPLNGPGVLAYAQGQVDAGNYAQLDDFYNSNDNLWARSAFWFLSDAERAFATESSMSQSASSKYTDWLPSLNFKVELSERLLGRFAVSKAMAQPTMGRIQNKINTSAELDVVQGIPADKANAARWETAPQSASVIRWEGAGGNPFLEPMESVQWDASLEWYFADSSSLTGGLFYKDLSNFFIYGSNPQDITNGSTGQMQSVLVESQVNGEEGKMYGYELAYTQFFDNLPGFWNGLGMQANYTHVKASGVPPTVDGSSMDTSTYNYVDVVDIGSLPLVGQSEHTANLVLMYQKYDWQARLAYNWRSEYLVSYRDGITNLPVWQDDAAVLDASLIYNINENVTFSLQANNLMDTESNLSYVMDSGGTRAGKSWFIAERSAVASVRLRF